MTRVVVRNGSQWLPALAFGAALLVQTAHGQVPAGRAAAEPVAPAARTDLQWLQAMQAAAKRQNYRGTLVYQSGSEARSSRVAHYFDGAVSHERFQMLDGRPREYVRRDDEVQCLFPDKREVVIERRASIDNFPALATGAPAEILKHYEVRIGEVERVAGHECQILNVVPRDALRYGYRLWVERASGLLLRAQMLDERGEVVEKMGFTDVQIGTPVDRAALKPSWSVAGWRVARRDVKAAEMASLGWSLAAPAGFIKVMEVQRAMPGNDGQERPAMQAVYSDGLAMFSVLIETGGAGGAATAAARRGPTSVASRRVGDATVTVVGEVPPATTRSVVQSVVFQPR